MELSPRSLRLYLLLASTPLVPWLGLLPWGRWAVPLLAPLTVYVAFTNRVRLKDYLGAWRLGLGWAALLSAGVIAMVWLVPEMARDAVVHGEPHRQEMFRWIASGEGGEGDLARFLPRHLSHLALFVLLSWISAGYLGLAMGAVLTGSMSYFVGSYAAVSGNPWLGVVVAWVPWSVLRVLAFVLLGSLFARPLLVKRPWPFGGRELRLMFLAATGIVGYVLIQAFLADGYGRALLQLADGLGGS